MFLFLFIFNDFCPTNCLKINRTDVRQIPPEISFSSPQRTLPWQPLFVGFIHRSDGCRWTLAAGAAGRANVGLCLASSFSLTL